MDELQAYFLETYDQSRLRFRQQLVRLKNHWPKAVLGGFAVAGDEDVTMDWIEAPAEEHPGQCLIITTGLHGAEGLAGAAAMQRLLERWLPALDASRCGLLLVHAVNPWGMRHFRRVNAHNVDLNRNFLDFEDTLPANLDYRLLDEFLAPRRQVDFRWRETLSLAGLVVRLLSEYGFDRIKGATLLGQYEFPRGLYFGGQSMQEETGVVLDLVTALMDHYQHVLHIDMHTGYGPSGRATVVLSPEEKRTSQEMMTLYNYPLISKTDPEEFYAIQGDMIDYFTRLAGSRYPAERYSGMAFEFGTLGENLLALVASLQATMLENRLYLDGAQTEAVQSWVEARYRDLFFPSDPSWRAAVIDETDRALEGVLGAEGFMGQA